jgi:NADPH-dependent glutamate synthase beta subunit-like oxidoreductase
MSNTDITKPADLTGHAEGTGPLRQRRPVYVDFMPPCNSACPAGENIQAWMAYAQAGNYFEAFQTLVEDNPFPAIMGRVCVKPCETGCNRTHIDTTVNIHAVERFIGDEAIKQKWPIQFVAYSTGKRVLVIGAGPSGLSAAYHLTRMGHTVEVFEASDHSGGLLWTGVPDYRLPPEILDFEVERIERTGVKIRLNYKVTDVMTEKEAGKFDAVYLATGAQVIHKEKLDHDDSVYITDAFSFFRERKSNPTPYSKKKVVVYGGGKVALYIARMIKRLDSEVVVYFEGDNKLMPAYDYETEDALAEGVEVKLLRSIKSIEKNQVILEKMKVEKGKAISISEFETAKADVLIIANRQEPDSGFLRTITGMTFNEDGTIRIDAKRMTSHEGIFAGGDMLPGENRSSTIAIGHGKKAARNIDGYLKNQQFIKGEKHPTASYRKLQLWYKTYAPIKEQGKLKPEIAVKSFDEVVAGLSEKEARYEAQRCLSCGNCFECDGCFAACPEDAIIKLGKGNRYNFNYDACTGCAVCYEQCPCHAIEMIPENSLK